MGNALLLAIITALEPLPIVAFIVVLDTEHWRSNSLGYICGWLISIASIMALTAIWGGTSQSHTSPAPTVLAVVEILAGSALLGFFVYRKRHPIRESSSDHSSVGRMDSLRPQGAAITAFLLQPWTLVSIATLNVLKGGHSDVVTLGLLVGFAVVATSSYVAIRALAIRFPEATTRKLTALRHWIESHREQAILAIALVVGAWLVIRGVGTLLTA